MPAAVGRSVESTIEHVPQQYRGRTAPRKFPPKVAFDKTPVRVHDARGLSPPPNLVDDKFCIVRHKSAARVWDAAEVSSVWCAEAAALIQRLTGCEEVIINGFQFRTQRRAPTPADRGLAPKSAAAISSSYATAAHNDHSVYTETVASPNVLEKTRGRHFRHYNLWRSVDTEAPVAGNPLALLHPVSTATEDLILTDQPPVTADAAAAAKGDPVALKRLGGYAPLRLTASPRHRWMFFDQMRHDEVLVFQQYDSRAEDPRMRQVIHCAFVDPTAPPSAPPRMSVEVRAVCLFGADPEQDARRARWKARLPVPAAAAPPPAPRL